MSASISAICDTGELNVRGKPQEEMPAAPRTRNRWCELLEAIFNTDTRYIEYTSSRPSVATNLAAAALAA